MSSPKNLKLMESLNREVRRFIANAILFNLKVAGEVGLNGTDMQCLNLLELQGSATPGELARWAISPRAESRCFWTGWKRPATFAAIRTRRTGAVPSSGRSRPNCINSMPSTARRARR